MTSKARMLREFSEAFSKKIKATPDSQIMTADGTMTMRRAATKVVAYSLAEIKPNTVKAYKLAMRHFMEYVKTRSYKAANKNVAVFHLLKQNSVTGNEMLAYFKNYLITKAKLSPTSTNSYLGHMRAVVNAANTLGVITWQCRVANLKMKDKKVSGYTPKLENILTIIDYLKNKKDESSSFTDHRNYLMFMFMWVFALRVSETNVHSTHIDKDGIFKVKNKGYHNLSSMLIPDPLLQSIEDYLNIRGRSKGHLFFDERYYKYRRYMTFDEKNLTNEVKPFSSTQVNHMLKKWGYLAGVYPKPADPGNKLSVHSIRRASITRASELAQADGLPIEAVKNLSRHKSIRTLVDFYSTAPQTTQKHISTLLI